MKKYFSVKCLLLLPLMLSAQKPADKDVEIRVADVGNGLCCVISIPGDHYIVYDAGSSKDKGKSAMLGLRKNIPKGKRIDLLVLSHPDDEHLGAADSIILTYNPKKVLRCGYIGNPKKDSTTSIKKLAAALKKRPEVEDMNLNREGKDIEPGMSMSFGEAKAIFLSGFGKPLDEWGLAKDKKSLLDALSIVMRLEYKGRSVLFCGDALGWNEKLDDTDCIAEERFILDNAPAELIKSDVLIASQGGGIRGSSFPFVRKAVPEYVVFSAGIGKSRAEPRYVIVDRFAVAGTPVKNMFRTDRGDGFDYYPKPNVKPKQWDREGVDKCVDKTGDDDVRIVISGEGALKVAYYNYRDPCR
ncbi:MAG: ComEC/Rec2 family competence protein [Flavobacteriales bacterium]